MTARVLIVDDIPTNVRLLEARLTAEITAAVDDATEYGESQPDPDPATAMRHVYAEDPD